MNVQKAALEMRGITKSFAGNIVLANVDLTVERGEVHALVGENGAGKSTLMKILAGVYRPDSGDIFMDGRAIHFGGPAAEPRVQAGAGLRGGRSGTAEP